MGRTHLLLCTLCARRPRRPLVFADKRHWQYASPGLPPQLMPGLSHCVLVHFFRFVAAVPPQHLHLLAVESPTSPLPPTVSRMAPKPCGSEMSITIAPAPSRPIVICKTRLPL